MVTNNERNRSILCFLKLLKSNPRTYPIMRAVIRINKKWPIMKQAYVVRMNEVLISVNVILIRFLVSWIITSVEPSSSAVKNVTICRM